MTRLPGLPVSTATLGGPDIASMKQTGSVALRGCGGGYAGVQSQL